MTTEETTGHLYERVSTAIPTFELPAFAEDVEAILALSASVAQ
jgi:hypothetical protein